MITMAFGRLETEQEAEQSYELLKAAKKMLLTQISSHLTTYTADQADQIFNNKILMKMFF